MEEHIDIVDFTKTLFLRPKVFFSTWFSDTYRQPFFRLAISLFGIGYGIDRVEAKMTVGGFTDNWLMFWCVAIFGGTVFGYIVYLIAGWFYNVRIKWSGGTPDLYVARSLVLYSSLIYSIPIILLTIVSFVIHETPSQSPSLVYSIILLVVLIFAQMYSIYASFSGVTTITDVDNGKARLWFLGLPIAVYLLIYFFLFRSYIDLM